MNLKIIFLLSFLTLITTACAPQKPAPIVTAPIEPEPTEEVSASVSPEAVYVYDKEPGQLLLLLGAEPCLLAGKYLSVSGIIGRQRVLFDLAGQGLCAKIHDVLLGYEIVAILPEQVVLAKKESSK
ncbi:hypothetical protein COT42_02300 [Candidatus Saganbacteria bacterium CG08_land_8_20_14_0_20_45_16]|uniref:Pilus assembly protein PilP n=1 Tax=Candidatus Saganbacteria bacterium CG08_land_8_20_14_0_20_45_16 TaxID=2014293 RepID=A0A2H0Y063_UNCSA|nr:MAG: hypothetical protein COT42_02300 [Candidatus Saganbacteria bacterium CG08_land_8_20_14_0_20_45_16]